ncbi:uncharacterized protein BYT42DRAFT_89710 [Radiomyces spectabilis]|uniref:uncharacterized protein n=1 Tax=Radiomyces spectabilis TaxID=64574 RepID=UPI002220115E|nr:uncharacterized protein BYT42DRAFT_89710 [Radiomyces spectabilis]KAI8370470.1 hypothetical protein BYT42DRAFT_89710 [Radiomyces spectabilis]
MENGHQADENGETEQRQELIKNVLELQTQLRGLISRVDTARKEHQSLLTENQMLQKYINNSLTSTAVFGATGGAVGPAAVNKSTPDSSR